MSTKNHCIGLEPISSEKKGVYLSDIHASFISFPTLSVRWQKELFKDVEIDTTQPPYVFKCQLYDLTGVPPERQKIMVKGGLLKMRLLKLQRRDLFLLKIFQKKSKRLPW
ncbi:hypothetical protein CIPAW_05G194700 [Carya illinoinensis]|uniref:ubiquitinyl hydrolase 1 n=1 Tax=Carya illinoinensis TaxID=32201 RepID=A0A8T1QLH1_CARIL|nr:hypothetical protein CIPAW_05G194700 [Carya illinoinensis]